MKKIKLTQGRFALVDDEDFEWLNQWKWSFSGHKGRKHGYAVRRIYPNGRYQKGIVMLMHRFIMDPPANMEVDHVDRNTTNCQRHNLRICSRFENMRNTSKRENRSGFRGVYWYQSPKSWGARIVMNKKHIFLGLFENKEDAARSYDEAAKKYHKEFARLNFPCDN